MGGVFTHRVGLFNPAAGDQMPEVDVSVISNAVIVRPKSDSAHVSVISVAVILKPIP